MAWERRQRGTLYYTRTLMINGRQVREYFGTGPLGILAAEADRQARLQRDQERQRWMAEVAAIEALEQPLCTLDGTCRKAMRDHLHAAGFYNHHGEWRRRHDRSGRTGV